MAAITADHLDDASIAELARELDAIRAEVIADRGERDADYIRSTIATQRGLETAGRLLLMAGVLPPAWLAGTTALGLSKVLENMEIGHNVMHGQWDWMNDPEIHSSTWEWDNASPADQWKHSHNVVHHTYTNVVGKDLDVGYKIMRMSPDQEWKPAHLLQPAYNMLLAALFQWGVAFHDLDLDALADGKAGRRKVLAQAKAIARKISRQVTKDYVAFPLLAGPFAGPVLAGNLTANLARNVWSHAVIFCGHFPTGVEQFDESQLDGETPGEWYVRQILGSANIEGGRLFNLMTGQLSFQIEHHLFPDLPSNRYAEIAPRVQELCARYGLSYTTGGFAQQYASMLKRVIMLSVPFGPGARPAPRTDLGAAPVEALAAAA